MVEGNGQYLRRSEAAAHLKSKYGFGATQTLAKLACIGGGPVFHKLGRFPLYRVIDLDEWAMGRMSGPVRSTSAIHESITGAGFSSIATRKLEDIA